MQFIVKMISLKNLELKKDESIKGKSKYIINGNKYFAEEAAIKYYEHLRYSALWTENDYWWVLMALLFWDIIFAKVPGSVNAKFGGNKELYPNDPGFNDAYEFMKISGLPSDFFTTDFYERRKDLIKNKIFELINTDLRQRIIHSYNQNYGKTCRPIENWDKFSLEQLLIPVNTMDNEKFLKILYRLISNFRDNRSGLPDLVVYNHDKIFFSEVKSENDRVSEKQRTWHNFLSDELDMKVELFLINHTVNKIKRLKRSYNFSFKDFPAYILFLDKANGHMIGKDFQGYFKYEYEVDTNLLLEEAIQVHHLTESDLSFRVEQSTVNSLKKILRNHGLKVSGRKKELIERVKDNLTENEIKDDFPDNYYVLTDEGINLVKDNDHILYYHKSKIRVFSLEKYHELLKDENKKDPNLKYDLALNLLEEYALKERKAGNWGLYRCSLLLLAYVYEDVKDELRALEHYFKVINIDFSGLSNNNSYDPQFCILAPGLIPLMIKLIERLDLDDKSIEKMYHAAEKQVKLPKTALKSKESFKYLMRAIKGDLEGANSIIKNKTRSVVSEDLEYEMARKDVTSTLDYSIKTNSDINNINIDKSVIEKKYCPSCGIMIKIQTNFCRNCGEDLHKQVLFKGNADFSSSKEEGINNAETVKVSNREKEQLNYIVDKKEVKKEIKRLTGGFILSKEYKQKLNENGLSIGDGIKIQKELKNRFKEGCSDISEIEAAFYLLIQQNKN